METGRIHRSRRSSKARSPLECFGKCGSSTAGMGRVWSKTQVPEHGQNCTEQWVSVNTEWCGRSSCITWRSTSGGSTCGSGGSTNGCTVNSEGSHAVSHPGIQAFYQEWQRASLSFWTVRRSPCRSGEAGQEDVLETMHRQADKHGCRSTGSHRPESTIQPSEGAVGLR